MADDPLDALSPAFRDALPGLMRAAIAAARRADAPFGCVAADAESGASLVEAPNSAGSDPTGHAEVNALRGLASKHLEPGRVVLVSTAEPCPMCAAASWWAGVRGIVFGTSIAELMAAGFRQIDIPCAEVLGKARPASTIALVGGFLAAETAELYADGP